MKEGFKVAFDGFTRGWIEGSVTLVCTSSIIFMIGIGLHTINEKLINKKGE